LKSGPRQNQLLVIAAVCLIAGMAFIGLPVGATGPLRYFGGGILVGLALLLFIFGRRTF
jgi:hypothetical protein